MMDKPSYINLMFLKPFLLVFIFAILTAACVRRIPNEPGSPPITAQPSQVIEVVPDQASTHSPDTILPSPEPTTGTGQVIEMGYLDEQVFIVIQIPEEDSTAYYGQIGKKRFTCTRQNMFRKRIYCYGELAKTEADMTLLLYSQENDRIKYRVELLKNNNEH